MIVNQEEGQDQQDDNFVIDNDVKADWALQKIKDLKEKKQEKEELAEERIQMIEDWLQDETEKIDNSIEHFEAQLEEYAMQLKEQDEDLKTRKLPFGKLQFRKQRPSWNYKDDKLLESVKEAGLNNLIKTKERVKKRELKKKVEVVGNKVVNAETGEFIEGVEVKERGEKFKIKVNS